MPLGGRQHRHEGEEGLLHKCSAESDRPDCHNRFPDFTDAFPQRAHKISLGQTFTIRSRYQDKKEYENRQAQQGEVRQAMQSPKGYVPGKNERPHCKPGSSPEAENRHAQPGAPARVGRNHPGRSGVIDGRTDGTHTDQQQDNSEIGCDSHKGDANRAHKGSDQKDHPGAVAVGQIAEYGLDQKGHEGGDPGNHAHLGQVQAEFVRQHR